MDWRVRQFPPSGPGDFLPPVLAKGHRDAVAIGVDRGCFDGELDLNAQPGQMVAVGAASSRKRWDIRRSSR